MFFEIPEKEIKPGRKKYLYLASYTVCFVMIAAVVFSPFIINKKSFIWVPDGLQQHYNALLYYRTWLLDIIYSVFRDHNLCIPLWDMNIGLGSDILTTLHYYVIGDPLNLFSVFVPDESYMEQFYCGLILVRIYLAGLAFSAYCRYHEQKPFSTLLGALVYAFCFWVIVAVRHPYFLNPMIYLPLILIGVDKIYKKEKPWLYIGMLAVATISSFYFAYMICIFVVVYAVLRYFMIFRKLRINEVWRWLLKFIGYSLTAMSLVSFVLVPVIAMTLSTGRAGTRHNFSIFYSPSYYIKLISGFLIGGSSNWSELGYTGLMIIAVIFLLSNRKKYLGLRLGFIFMTCLILLPYAGSVLNGGSYAINRYMWAYSMLVSFIAVKMYPQIMDMKMKKRVQLFWGGITYIFICLEIWSHYQKQYILVALLMFTILLWMIIGTRKKTKEKFWFKSALLAAVMCQLMYQGWVEYAPQGAGYVEEFANQGEAHSMLTDYAAGSLVTNQAKDTTWRYESLQTEEWKNSAMQLGLNGVSYYFSLANPYISEFQREMYINQTRDFCYSGFDGRSMLDVLSGVRYFIIPEEKKSLLPYQFDKCINRATLAAGSQYEVKAAAYENRNVLPLTFASNTYIDRQDYEKMTVTQKQQALLQGVVVERDELQEGKKAAKPEFLDQKIPYTITDIKNANLTDNSIEVTEEDATLTLQFEGVPESETYFILTGLDYTEKGSLLRQQKNRLHIEVTCGDINKKITFLTRENNFYSGVTDFLINTGCRTDAVTEMKICFQEKGTYRFDDMKIVCQPVQQIAKWKDALEQQQLEHVTVSDNQVRGNISLDDDKLLCLTLPYSEGWSAYVDGTKTEILRADTMYMAIEVPAGNHQIRFQYVTPYLKTGSVLSMIGLATVIALVFFDKRRERIKK